MEYVLGARQVSRRKREGIFKTRFEHNGTSELPSTTITTHLHINTLSQPSGLESTADQKNLLSTFLQAGQLA
jgi:hypothetical protein